jgi:hypothetical protein
MTWQENRFSGWSQTIFHEGLIDEQAPERSS